MEERKFDLEDRLVDYVCRMIDVVEALPTTRTGNYIAGNLSDHVILLLLIMAKFRLQNQKMILFIK